MELRIGHLYSVAPGSLPDVLELHACGQRSLNSGPSPGHLSDLDFLWRDCGVESIDFACTAPSINKAMAEAVGDGEILFFSNVQQSANSL